MNPYDPDEALRRRVRWGSGALIVLVALGVVYLIQGSEAQRVFLLRDYNTRLVVLSTMLMGIASGVVGTFLLLRKRSLMGDALSHATLPGVAGAYLVLYLAGSEGRSLGWLLMGASLAGLLGAMVVLWLRRLPRIKEDTAMGLVLSVFYGAGVVLLGFIQELPAGSSSGLEAFIYGKTASLVQGDFILLAAIALVSVACALLLYKELRLLCFDEAYASSLGWPVRLLDAALLILTCAVTVAGLQAVGLILIIAFLVIPAATARMWTENLSRLLLLAAFFGGLSGWMGASASALLPKLPAGAVIVLAAAALFVLSLMLGTSRGLLLRWARHRSLRKRILNQHLLRAAYEEMDAAGQLATTPLIRWSALLARRTWSPREVWRAVAAARQAGLILLEEEGFRLTGSGFQKAAKVTRNHRLWELYLIEHADIAPNHVDRDADSVEHILGERLTRQLELALPEQLREAVAIPDSPHEIR
jgi:manganese/zinc/iron transport system permease protein